MFLDQPGIVALQQVTHPKSSTVNAPPLIQSQHQALPPFYTEMTRSVNAWPANVADSGIQVGEKGQPIRHMYLVRTHRSKTGQVGGKAFTRLYSGTENRRQGVVGKLGLREWVLSVSETASMVVS